MGGRGAPRFAERALLLEPYMHRHDAHICAVSRSASPRRADDRRVKTKRRRGVCDLHPDGWNSRLFLRSDPSAVIKVTSSMSMGIAGNAKMVLLIAISMVF